MFQAKTMGRGWSAWGKALALVVASALMLSAAVGTTYAYLWDKSDTFKNTFAAEVPPAPLEQANLSISGTKNLEGRQWAEGDSFAFLLQRHAGEDPETGEDVWETVDRQTVTYNPVAAGDSFDAEAFNQFDFDEALQGLTFGEAGTYAFRIVEEIPTGDALDPQLAYDAAVHAVSVTVGKADQANALEIKSVAFDEADVPATEDGAFAVTGADFTNRHDAAQAVVDIRKTVDDTTKAEGAQDAMSPAGFSFALYAADEGFQVAEGAQPVEGGTAATDSLGTARITLPYTAADLPADASQESATLRYVLRETVPAEPVAGMSYDDADRYVQVTVARDAEGVLTALAQEYVAVETAEGTAFEPRKDAEGAIIEPGATVALAFENTYDPQDASATIGGTKTLTGRDLAEGEFSFQLFESAVGFPAAGEDARALKTASNDAEGAFSFESLAFPRTGTYYYTVSEDASAALENVTYDAAVYGVTVKVTDPGTGALEAQVSIKNLSTNEQAEAIAFENVYTEPVQPPVDPDDPDDPDDPGSDPELPSTGDQDKPGTDPELPSTGTLAPSTGDGLGDTSFLVVSIVSCMAAVVLLILAARARKVE